MKADGRGDFTPRKGQPASCYVFYGEEKYLAEQFVRDLRAELMTPDAPVFNVERFDLEETRWADVIDTARTAPFFFAPWQIVVAEVSGEAKAKLSSLEEKIIKDYCLSPSSRTVLVIIVSGKVKRSHPLVTFIGSLPSPSIVLTEIRPLKEKELLAWIDRRLRAQGKAATPEAAGRLAEITANDLQRVDNELLKIVSYIGDRKVIDVEDVHEVCDWTRSFVEWELSNSLEKADREQLLVVLNQFFKEGEKPEFILGIIAAFFRNILLAKVWLKENRDRKEIFAQVMPQIQESWRDLYATKFRDFFSLVGGISDKDLKWFLAELEKIDLAIKTTEVSHPQILLERFVFDYCGRRSRPREKPGFTWRGKG
jgi:DNA polymerase III delta subunit